MLLFPLLLAFQVGGLQPAAADSQLEDQRRAQRIEQMFGDYQHEFSNTPTITAPELIGLIANQKTLLVDVRTSAEQNVSMIPHAITKEEFEMRREQYKARKLICYCTIGYRSGLYASKLRSEGFDASNLKGGVLAWAHAHQMFVDPKGKTNRVHVYSSKWNLTPSGYVAIW